MNDILTQLRPQEALRREDDEFGGNDLAGWGSHAGYGNLGRSGGVEGMSIPRVPDVSLGCLLPSCHLAHGVFHACADALLAFSIPQHLHRLHVDQPSGQDQAGAWYDNAGVQVQGRHHRSCRLSSNSWQLCRYVKSALM